MSTYSAHLLANYSSGLLCYYQLNDASSPWADSGPNSLPLTAHAGYSLSQPSLLPSDNGSTANGCTLFSGGYGSHIGSTVFSSLTQFAIAGWCQPPFASLAGAPGYIFGGAGRWVSAIGTHGAELYPTATATATVTQPTATSIDSVQANVPSFVVAWYNGADITVYVNGVFINQSAKTGAIGADVAYGVGANGVGTNLFAGYLQHVAMWGVTSGTLALTLANIQDLYVQGVQGNYPGSAGATFQAYAFPWSVEVLPANASRKRVTFVNDSNAIIYLELSATGATVGNGIQLLPNGGKVTIETYTGAISAIFDWPQGYKSLTIMEE